MKSNLVRPVMAALFLITITISSCDKQDNGVGIGLFSRENNLGIEFIDTFVVVSSIRAENSIRTSGFTDVLLGTIDDPFFGLTKTSFYSQFLINESGVSFSDSAICDSLILYIKLGSGDGDDFYGPENKEMTFNVHRINSDADFSLDSIYYSHSSIEVFNETLLDPTFDNTFKPNFDDTIQVGLDTLDKFIGVMKLKLDPAFGQEIMDLSGTEVLSGNAEFLKVYKGLYVTTDGDPNGSVLNIDYSSAATTLILYKHIETDTVVSSFSFGITEKSAHFTEFKHDYEGTGSDEFNAILNDTVLANKKYFLQAGGGFSVDIKMPTLGSIVDSLGVLPINKAELIMPVDPNTSGDFIPGDQFFMTRIDDDGVERNVIDQGTANFDGTYNVFRSEYRFNITSHIQSFLNGVISKPDVRIDIKKQGTSVNRSILFGHNADTSNGEKALLLRIYYSTLND